MPRKAPFGAAMTALLVLAVLFLPHPALAITAWARKYGMACGACHVPAGFRLTRDGIDFMRMGHRYPVEGAKKEPAAGAAPDAFDVTTEKIAEYLSLNAKVRFNDGNDDKTTGIFLTKDEPGRGGKWADNRVGQTTFEFHALALYSGGPISDRFSFFSEVYLHERELAHDERAALGNNINDGGRSKLAEAYLQFTTMGENYVTARVGQLAPQLWSIQGAGPRVAETRSYLMNNATIRTNEGIQNNWLPRARDYGMEVGGHLGQFHCAAGLVNGTGNTPTNVIEGKGQNAKDAYGSVDYTFLDSYQLGVFGHRGYIEANTVNYTAKPGEITEQLHDGFSRVGAGVNANPIDQVWIVASYIRGLDRDSIPPLTRLSRFQKAGYDTLLDRVVISRGYSVELDVPLEVHGYSVAPFVRYDYFTHDSGATYAVPKRTTTVTPVVGFSVGLFGGQRGRVVVQTDWVRKVTKTATKYSAIGVEEKEKDRNFRVELSYML